MNKLFVVLAFLCVIPFAFCDGDKPTATIDDFLFKEQTFPSSMLKTEIEISPETGYASASKDEKVTIRINITLKRHKDIKDVYIHVLAVNMETNHVFDLNVSDLKKSGQIETCDAHLYTSNYKNTICFIVTVCPKPMIKKAQLEVKKDKQSSYYNQKTGFYKGPITKQFAEDYKNRYIHMGSEKRDSFVGIQKMAGFFIWR